MPKFRRTNRDNKAKANIGQVVVDVVPEINTGDIEVKSHISVEPALSATSDLKFFNKNTTSTVMSGNQSPISNSSNIEDNSVTCSLS